MARGAMRARGEIFEIMWEYKNGDLDIGEAYDLILAELGKKRGPRLLRGERGTIVEEVLRGKKKRKTPYQTAFAAAYKRLKKKHPRTAFGSLSKKAHAAARKKVKK